jgi:hypothetical protein
MTKTKKHYRKKIHRTRKHRFFKGGARPSLEIIKGLNLLDQSFEKYLDPFIGCAYVEMNMVDALYNVFKIPINEPILDKYKTQHHRLINLLFKNVFEKVVPIHTLADNGRLSIEELSKFMVIRYLWTIFDPSAIKIYERMMKEKAQLKRSITQINDNKQLEQINPEKYKKLINQKEKLETSINTHFQSLITIFGKDRIDHIHNIMVDSTNTYLKPIQQFIPLGSPMNMYCFHLLSALLWWKCSMKSDYLKYYQTIKPYIDIFLPTHKFIIPDDFETVQYTEEDRHLKVFRDPYELFYSCYMKYRKQNQYPTIKLILYGSVPFDGIPQPFSDCGETTLRNFIRLFIFDHTTKTYDLSLLERWGAIPKIIEFFTEYNEELQNTDEARKSWALITSGRDDIIYNIQNKCDMSATFDNHKKLISQLFTNIRDITDFTNGKLKTVIYDTDMFKHLQLLTSYYIRVVIINEYNNPVYMWVDGGSGHSDIKFANTHSYIPMNNTKIKYNGDINYAYQFGRFIGLKYDKAHHIIHNINPYLYDEEYIYIEMKNGRTRNKYIFSGKNKIYTYEDYTILLGSKKTYEKCMEDVDGDIQDYIYIPSVKKNNVNDLYLYKYSTLYNYFINKDPTTDNTKLLCPIKKLWKYDTFIEFEKLDLISPNITSLCLDFTDHEDKINDLIRKYPTVNTLYCNKIVEPVIQIRNLLITKFEPHLISENIKCICLNTYNGEIIPEHVEELYICTYDHNSPNIVANSYKLCISFTSHVKHIVSNIIPPSTRILYLGLMEDIYSDEYIKLQFNTSHNMMFFPNIINLNEGIEELYIINKSFGGYRGKISVGALPTTIKKIEYIHTQDEFYKTIINKKILSRRSFKYYRPDIILENIELENDTKLHRIVSDEVEDVLPKRNCVIC